jgi:hypothetical protein
VTRRRDRHGWSELIVSSGLAASITGIVGFVSVWITQTFDLDRRSCEIAAAYLQDERPSPYLDANASRQVVRAAAARFLRCMKE